MKSITILKNIAKEFQIQDVEFELDEKTELLNIHYHECCINIEEKDNAICVSFATTMDPTFAAIITKIVCKHCIKYKAYTVEVMEPYAHVFDENNICIDVLFGDEALEYHFKTTGSGETTSFDM